MTSPTRARARMPVHMPFGRRLIKAVLGPYMRLYHRVELTGWEHVPPHGPLIVVLNHASLLDVPALMVVDPFPDTRTVVKASMFKIPVVSWFLHQWNAIPVERQGRDSTGVRAMLGVLRAGGVLAVAAEGRRTRSGRLESINPVLARIVATAGVPILPLGISGSFRALPPGARFPRPVKILIRAGPCFRVARGTDAATAAARIRVEIAALLPPEMQPLTPR
ncbi:MAG TPA: lysophospholipid acyltransferase family protein [Chloroflexota bacterium]